MKAKATWKEYPLAGGVSDDTTSLATDAVEDEVDRQLAGGTPFRCAPPFLGAVGVTSTPVI